MMNNDQPEFVSEPMVLQCSSCLVIVGDSLGFMSADEEMQTITLKTCARIAFNSEQLETSTNELDLGSTFIPFFCESCKKQLGKVYKTTPKQLDFIRDFFTFDATCLLRYNLDSGEHAADASAFIPANHYPSIQSIQNLIHTQLKSKELSLAQSERISELEEKMSRLEQTILQQQQQQQNRQQNHQTRYIQNDNQNTPNKRRKTMDP